MARILGSAIYSAYRQAGILYVTAEGNKPYLQTKVSLDQLPILIFPPRLALFFDTPDIANPKTETFSIERAFPHYPTSVANVSILDAKGMHTIEIEERGAPDVSPYGLFEASDTYCVFQQIGTQNYVIAKCDAPIIAIYHKVHGPASRAECETFIAEQSASRSVRLVKDSFKAWISAMPGTERKLIVTGDVRAKMDTVLELISAIPGSFIPTNKLLRVNVVSATPTKLPITVMPLRYEQSVSGPDYQFVTVLCEGDSVTIPVTIAH